ncbi:17-beta-hydroxysteroid dehydrogenase 13 [Haematobia irritans]|uniref:17-beta-hydroxysteroid dehydrogenase 13 n=1 Tax=Haematobia irritans TaxID=7368 RepID=UPI003F4F6B25
MASNELFVSLKYSSHLLCSIILFPLFLIITVIGELFFQRNETNIHGEVAVVTGGAQGLGRQLAIELAKRGCDIAVVDILEDKAKDTAKYLNEVFNVKAKSYKVDISNYHQLVDFHSQVVRDFDDITIVVNNAGLIRFTDSSSPMTFGEIQMLVNVNFTSHLWINQLFLPRMKQLKRGHIMAVSSLSALFPTPIVQHYGSTKSAIRSYMASLRADLGSENYGIQITTIMPTYLTTHEATKNFLTTCGLSEKAPLLDGAYVAGQAVSGMLRGLDEMALPQACSIIYKLLELLPTWMRDRLFRLIQPKIDVKSFQYNSK